MTGLDPNKRNKQRQHQRQRTCPSNKEIFNVVAAVPLVVTVVVVPVVVVVVGGGVRSCGCMDYDAEGGISKEGCSDYFSE